MKYKDIELGEVLEFWFEELSEKDWFEGGDALDQKITDRFSGIHKSVAAGEYWKHRTTAYSYLAEVVVLDQFSRQMHRSTRDAFAYDSMALTLAQEAIVKGFDTELSQDERLFLYMPFMHSESAVIHVEAVKLFTALGDEESLKYERIHKDLIDRFGRYPHRNEQLGRESTEEERAYLAENTESFFDS